MLHIVQGACVHNKARKPPGHRFLVQDLYSFSTNMAYPCTKEHEAFMQENAMLVESVQRLFARTAVNLRRILADNSAEVSVPHMLLESFSSPLATKMRAYYFVERLS